MAVAYATRGVRIIPAREADGPTGAAKSPYVLGGFKAASPDLDLIGTWWGTWPMATIGLACRANGIIVLDADRHGSGDGVENASSLFAQCGFDPGTIPVIVTPRDGRHFIFRRPDGLGDTKGQIASAVDVRDNAYVIAAGSTLPDGRRYELTVGSVAQLAAAIAERTLPALPSALCELIAKPATGPRFFAEPCGPQALEDLRPRLAGLIRAVASAKSGQRNATLHWAACRAAELVDSGLLSASVAQVVLVEAAAVAGLTSREAVATVRSGLSSSRAA